jgi:hypothetical protein
MLARRQDRPGGGPALCARNDRTVTFEHAWTYTTEKGMREFLGRWRKLLNWSRLTSLIAFYDLLMRHIDGVVAWARHRLTNAALEGNVSARASPSDVARGGYGEWRA